MPSTPIYLPSSCQLTLQFSLHTSIKAVTEILNPDPERQGLHYGLILVPQRGGAVARFSRVWILELAQERSGFVSANASCTQSMAWVWSRAFLLWYEKVFLLVLLLLLVLGLSLLRWIRSFLLRLFVLPPFSCGSDSPYHYHYQDLCLRNTFMNYTFPEDTIARPSNIPQFGKYLKLWKDPSNDLRYIPENPKPQTTWEGLGTRNG